MALAASTEDWSFVAEGGANIVLSYRGGDSALAGNCLRLRKRRLLDDSPSDGSSGDPPMSYRTLVVEPLLGSQHLPKTESVQLAPSFVRRVQERITPLRSEERRREGDLDASRPSASLVEDLVGGSADVLTFEIKPKWAHLTTSLSDSRLDGYCRTCMLQGLQRGLVAKPRFCPLLLFSGDRDNVLYALLALFALWRSPAGAGNSFRIFSAGMLVDGPRNREVVSTEDLELLADTLARSPAMRRVAELQKRFDPLGIEELGSRLENEAAALEAPASLDELASLANGTAAASSSRSLFVSYTISATFKDCSLLIRTRKGRDGVRGLESIKVIDLDPKPLSRLPHYARSDAEMRDGFSRLLDLWEAGMTPCTELMR